MTSNYRIISISELQCDYLIRSAIKNNLDIYPRYKDNIEFHNYLIDFCYDNFCLRFIYCDWFTSINLSTRFSNKFVKCELRCIKDTDIFGLKGEVIGYDMEFQDPKFIINFILNSEKVSNNLKNFVVENLNVLN